MQRAAHRSRLKKKKARVVSQPVIDEASEEAVEELTGKDATPEEATVEAAVPVEVTAPEEVPGKGKRKAREPEEEETLV